MKTSHESWTKERIKMTMNSITNNYIIYSSMLLTHLPVVQQQHEIKDLFIVVEVKENDKRTDKVECYGPT